MFNGLNPIPARVDRLVGLRVFEGVDVIVWREYSLANWRKKPNNLTRAKPKACIMNEQKRM
jgi:hypothetical protein